jgi:hypothetical protein
MTEEEYDRLRDASEGQGARSVSEFARNALLTTTEPEPIGDRAGPSLGMLGDRIAKVEEEVAQVKDELNCHIKSQHDKPKTK